MLTEIEMSKKEAKMPLVSIVVPCYNHEKYIHDCLISIINQDYENIELIIIDDGSNDKSVEKINQLLGDCVKRFVRFEFRQRKNLGLSATLNEGLAWCSGTYYSPIASDDILLENKISLLVNVIENDQKIVAAFGSMLLIDENNRDIGKATAFEGTHTFEALLMNEHAPGAPAGIFRLRDILAVGGYLADIKMDDWYMWLKLTENGGLLRSVRSPVVKYRIHSANTAKNYKLMHEQRLMILKMYLTHPIYERALSRSHLVAASQSSSFADLKFTVSMLAKAKNEPITTRLKYLIKALTPSPLVKLIKNFKQ